MEEIKARVWVCIQGNRIIRVSLSESHIYKMLSLSIKLKKYNEKDFINIRNM